MKNTNPDSLLIRAAVAEDIERLLELSKLTGSGMTSMPSDRKSWEDKLDRSIADFGSEQPSKCGDIYFMVLEDLNTDKIVGCGAVYAGIGATDQGLTRPFYSYKLSTVTTTSEKLGLTVNTRLLTLVTDYTGTTEIGSLFLLPEYRRDGIGKFLSRSRFLLLADFPERFDETIFAELRGWLDKNDDSPFWEHLGHKFFGFSFQKADYISADEGFQFISDMMPKYPVYLDLLPDAAQEVVGKPHEAAAAAFHILQKEGFQYDGYVDIFDAGPTIAAPLRQIKTIVDSETVVLGTLLTETDHQQAVNYICSNCRLADYRLTRSDLVRQDDGSVSLPANAAEALKLKIGDQLRIVKS